MRRLILTLAVLALALGAARLAFRLPSLEGRTVSKSLAPDPQTPLARAILPAAAAHPALTGIRPLWKGIDAYAARILLARAARQSIDARYYIWQRDRTGLPLLAELKAAAERGVRVRLLVDDNGTPGMDSDLAAMNALPNFEVRVFNPFSLRRPRLLSYPLDFPRINRRMHNKSFTVDGVATIVGGRNVGDIYFARDADTQYSDFDVMATGAAVTAVAGDFDAYWNSGSAYPHELLVNPPADASGFEAALADVADDPESEDYARAVAEGQLVTSMLSGTLQFDWVPARLLSDDPAKALGEAPAGTLVANALGALLGNARESLDVISAYFVPGREGTERLAFAARQGIRVRVLTNGLEATDVLPVHAAYGKYRKPLIEAGVEVHELKRNPGTENDREKLGLLGSSGASLHAKVFAIDGKAVFVGSFNFDPRSIWLNCEMGLWIESPTMAASVASTLAAGTGELAWQVGLADGNLTWSARNDGVPVVTTDEPGTNAFKRAALAVLAWLPVEWMM
ncbi:MAG: phospholipase D family protein [Rhodobacteraceae bacterium]|jgi:putative cardiolipin synthase|nr:phospholipase D family protein [Paracoccaceae bacterium]